MLSPTFASLLTSIFCVSSALAASGHSGSPFRDITQAPSGSTLMTNNHLEFRMAPYPPQEHDWRPHFNFEDLNQPAMNVNVMSYYEHPAAINLYGTPPLYLPSPLQHYHYEPVYSHGANSVIMPYHHHHANEQRPHQQRNTAVRFRMNRENLAKRSRFMTTGPNEATSAPPDGNGMASPEGVWYPGYIHSPMLTIQKQEDTQVKRFSSYKSNTSKRVGQLINLMLQHYSPEAKKIVKREALQEGQRQRLYFENADELWEHTREWTDEELSSRRLSVTENDAKWINIIQTLANEYGNNHPEPKGEATSSSRSTIYS